MKKTALKRYGYQKNVFKKMRKRKSKLLLSDKFLDGDNSDGESNDCADGNKNISNKISEGKDKVRVSVSVTIEILAMLLNFSWVKKD